MKRNSLRADQHQSFIFAFSLLMVLIHLRAIDGAPLVALCCFKTISNVQGPMSSVGLVCVSPAGQGFLDAEAPALALQLSNILSLKQLDTSRRL